MYCDGVFEKSLQRVVDVVVLVHQEKNPKCQAHTTSAPVCEGVEPIEMRTQCPQNSLLAWCLGKFCTRLAECPQRSVYPYAERGELSGVEEKSRHDPPLMPLLSGHGGQEMYPSTSGALLRTNKSVHHGLTSQKRVARCGAQSRWFPPILELVKCMICRPEC